MSQRLSSNQSWTARITSASPCKPSDSPPLPTARSSLFENAPQSHRLKRHRRMDCGDISTPSDPGGSGSGGAEGPSLRREGCEALAKAISSTLGAVMREFDSRAVSAARSQDDLSLSLDRLTRELDKLLEDAPLPFIMQYATKISSVRKRVSALNLTLKSIQRRIDNMDRILSSGATTNNLQVTEHRHQQ